MSDNDPTKTIVLYKLHSDLANIPDRWTVDRQQANFDRGDYAGGFVLPDNYRLDPVANVIRNRAGFACAVVADAVNNPRLVNLEGSIDQEPELIPLNQSRGAQRQPERRQGRGVS